MAGIVSYGIYLPEIKVYSHDIAKISGIPTEVIENKQGWKMKRISIPSEMPSEMAVKASQQALTKASVYGIRESDINAIMYVGSEFKDYGVWMAATKIQYDLNIHNAFAFDISAMCVGMIVGLTIAKRLTDLAPNILIVAASKESYLVNYKDPNTSWLNDFADGASAVIISKNFDKNRILESAFISDGRFWGAVVVKTLGAIVFKENITDITTHKFESLLEKDFLRQELSASSMKNFIRVITEALDRSGYTIKDVDLLVVNHMKRSFHEALIKELGLDPAKAPYLEDYGHTQSSDMIIGLDIGLRRGLVKDGSIVVFASGGTGFLWGAVVLRWG